MLPQLQVAWGKQLVGSATIHPIETAEKPENRALTADRVLARRAAGGDRAAFQEIVDSHKQRMFSVARGVLRDPVTAEDVVQEAFIKAYRALPDFRGDSRLSTWLYRITYLAAIDFKRHQARHLQLADEAPTEEIEDSSSVARTESSLEASQLRREIDAALDTLSPFEQTVFTLRHMQNFKLREIAQVVD